MTEEKKSTNPFIAMAQEAKKKNTAKTTKYLNISAKLFGVSGSLKRL